MAKNNLVVDGDSITLGQVAGSAPYLNYLNLNGWTATNLGVNGETLATMLANAPTHVDPLFVPGVKNIVVIWGGTNDFAISGATVAATYANLKSYCAGRRAAGFKVIVVTMLNRFGNNAVGGEPLQTDMQNYNALITANWQTFADGLADVTTNTRYGLASAYSDVGLYVEAPDGVHPTLSGVQNIIAPIIAQATGIPYNNPMTFGSVVKNGAGSAFTTSLSVVQTVQSVGDIIFLFSPKNVVMSVTDQLDPTGATWTPFLPTNFYSNLWWKKATSTTTLTITAHYASAQFQEIMSADYVVSPGYVASIDTFMDTVVATPGLALTGPFTVTKSNPLLVMFATNYGQQNESYNSSDGMIMRYNGGDNSITSVLGDRLVSASGNETGTFNGSNGFGIFIALVTIAQEIPLSSYSVPDCRDYGNFPNLSVNVNGTLTYTVPSVDSRKAGPPVDSRKAGPPVACGTYPQNSRKAGTFGPGE